MSSTPPTTRTQVKRYPDRASYDHDTVLAILDEALICHVAYVDASGSPRLIPTIHTRIGDTLYLHGSAASSTTRALRDGAEVAVTATIVDGLVMARSAAHHSMNYRSVVVYGRTREVTDREEQLAVARAIVEHIVPGRSGYVREPDATEQKATLMLALPIEEASAKIRTGPPNDDERDFTASTWAGVLPIGITLGEPAPHYEGIDVPEHISGYRRPGSR